MKENLFFTPIDQSLFDNRIVQISGVVDSELAYEVTRQLLAMEQADAGKAIYLFINSPGGEINSGFAIYDTARFIAPEVTTVVSGLAASMGSLIALCAKKENRFSLPNSKFLIHQPLVSGIMHGPASDIEIHAKDLLRTKEKINRIYAEETGHPVADIVAATDRDNWMTADEALEFGLISRIINNRQEMP